MITEGMSDTTKKAIMELLDGTSKESEDRFPIIIKWTGKFPLD